MDREVANDLYAACAKTLASLTEAEHAIHRISDEDERTRLLHALSDAIVKSLAAFVPQSYSNIRNWNRPSRWVGPTPSYRKKAKK
jgi:hypothetical protein